MTPVFLTVDTELAWRHHVAGLPLDQIVERSLEPAGVGIGWQLATLAAHGLKACFFVDPMPALTFGLAPFRYVVEAILEAGQEVQLHCHPSWTAATPGDRGRTYSRFDLCQYSRDEQTVLIGGASDLLVAAGAPRPIAFRAGNYGANDDTLSALAAIGIVYDSSYNAVRPMGIASLGDDLSPWQAGDVVECPVTFIDGGGGEPRPFQICALSRGETAAALDHAAAEDHASVVIVGHSFELATRAGTRANSVHVRRFEAMCAHLATRRDVLPTMHFADRPVLRLDGDARPLRASQPRVARRKAEQLWSNWVVERAA